MCPSHYIISYRIHMMSMCLVMGYADFDHLVTMAPARSTVVSIFFFSTVKKLMMGREFETLHIARSHPIFGH